MTDIVNRRTLITRSFINSFYFHKHPGSKFGIIAENLQPHAFPNEHDRIICNIFYSLASKLLV